MCTCSGNGIQVGAVQDLLCLVDLYLVYLIGFQPRYAIVLLCLVRFVGS